jgi:hypothetical protein
VARYNESIDWLNTIMDDCIIYNKGTTLNINNEVMLPNMGRESETYLHYIIDNYDNLPDVVVFTQGKITDHVFEFRGELHKYLLKLKDEAFNYGKSKARLNYLESDPDVNWRKDWNLRNGVYYLRDNYKDNKPIIYEDWFKTNINKDYPNPVHFYTNGLFAVKKEFILNKPIEYYKELIKEVNHHINSTEGHFFERAWYYIFTENPIKENISNPPQQIQQNAEYKSPSNNIKISMKFI